MILGRYITKLKAVRAVTPAWLGTMLFVIPIKGDCRLQPSCSGVFSYLGTITGLISYFHLNEELGGCYFDDALTW